MGSLRVLELFCGLGGAAAALEQIRDAGGGASEVVAAVDLSDPALAVYRFNHPEHPIVTAQIGALSSERLAAWRADLWWMSPPCQPYTRRGLRRDLDDPRARILPAVLERLVEVRPRYLALENVPGFAGSRAHAMLREALACGGYGELVEATLCPSRLGMPNRRERFYCVASRGELAPLDTDAPPARRPLVDLLDTRLDAPPAEEPPPELRVAPELLARYEGALDLVDVFDVEHAASGRSYDLLQP